VEVHLHSITTQKTTLSIFPLWKPQITSRTFLVKQQCSGYISLIMNFNPEDGGSMASETLVYNHQTTQHNNPENHDFCLFNVRTLNYAWNCLFIVTLLWIYIPRPPSHKSYWTLLETVLKYWNCFFIVTVLMNIYSFWPQKRCCYQ